MKAFISRTIPFSLLVFSTFIISCSTKETLRIRGNAGTTITKQQHVNVPASETVTTGSLLTAPPPEMMTSAELPEKTLTSSQIKKLKAVAADKNFAARFQSLYNKHNQQGSPTLMKENGNQSISGKLMSGLMDRIGDKQLLSVIVAIFLPFVGVAIWENGIGTHFWIALLFTLLFYLPGLIYALIIILG